MFDFVFDFIVETVGDFVSDLFDGATEASSAALEGQDVMGAVPEMPTSIEPPIESGGSSLAPIDGGIAPDRFDPKPPMGPYSP